MTTIKDIARECGVSANTVSCVLNNKLGEVGPATRERVLEAIHRLGYRPNAAARRMVGKKTNTIGIADRYSDHAHTDFYKAELIEPMFHAVRAGRRDVLYYSGHVDERGFSAFLDGRSDGLICISGAIDKRDVEALLSTEMPVVFVGTAQDVPTESGAAAIDVDNYEGAYLAVSYLVGLGHRRIAMMQGVGTSGNVERVAGYQRALADGGVAAEESLLFSTTSWDYTAYREVSALLEGPRGTRPTAIFCFNDMLAFAALKAADEHQVKVPEQLSIVGFDDVTLASISNPPLTTVHQPLGLIGRRAVEILVDVLEGRLPANHHEIVKPILVIRSSTAPPG
jgi:DNA-binding LacI/PurR family transcriptional regulator